MKSLTRWELSYGLGIFFFGLGVGLFITRIAGGSLASLELPIDGAALILLYLGYRWRREERRASPP